MDDQNTKREPPDWVTKRLTQVGGTNPYGKPNFRIIWGGNRTHTVTARFHDSIEVENKDGNKVGVLTELIDTRTLLKYHPFRWHLERWCPPDTYGTEEEWFRNTWDPDIERHTMGAYPVHGDYEHVFFLGICTHLTDRRDWCNKCKVGMGEYLELEPNVYMLERQIYLLKQSAEVLPGEQRAALFLRENLKRQATRNIVSARVRNAMRPVLATQPTSWQDGNHCSVPEAKIHNGVKMPRNHGIGQDRI